MVQVLHGQCAIAYTAIVLLSVIAVAHTIKALHCIAPHHCSATRTLEVSADVGRPFRVDASGKFHLRPGHTWQLLVSQLPCGDASLPAEPVQVSTTAAEQACLAGHPASGTQQAPTLRTGAKPIEQKRVPALFAATGSAAEAPLAPRAGAALADAAGAPVRGTAGSSAGAGVPHQGNVERGAQRVGCLRRKPGRGAATLSMSCRCARASSFSSSCFGVLGCEEAVVRSGKAAAGRIPANPSVCAIWQH